jgi:hypothetical protein
MVGTSSRARNVDAPVSRDATLTAARWGPASPPCKDVLVRLLLGAPIQLLVRTRRLFHEIQRENSPHGRLIPIRLHVEDEILLVHAGPHAGEFHRLRICQGASGDAELVGVLGGRSAAGPGFEATLTPGHLLARCGTVLGLSSPTMSCVGSSFGSPELA